MQRAKGLPIHFHIGVPASKVQEIMHISLIQWHLTGVELETTDDPASEEHFGISVAEGELGTLAAYSAVLQTGSVCYASWSVGA